MKKGYSQDDKKPKPGTPPAKGKKPLKKGYQFGKKPSEAPKKDA